MFSETQTPFEATKFFELIVSLFYLIVGGENQFHSSENLFILLSHVNQGGKYGFINSNTQLACVKK